MAVSLFVCPMSLPPLPARDEPWPSHVYHAVNVIQDMFRVASDMLAQGNYDISRILYHSESFLSGAVPLLFSLEEVADEEGIPQAWLSECAEKFHRLLKKLCEAEQTAHGVYVHEVHQSITYELIISSETSNVEVPQTITIEQTGKRGRPRKRIDAKFLSEAMNPSRRISLTELAKAIGVHRNTLRTYLKVYNVEHKFSQLSDNDLDILVKSFRAEKPDSGIRYLIGFLRRHGLRVQRRRVISSISQVDQLGRTLRRRPTKKRQEYKVARPNALWHIDGHHKLILWGIVIHGCVDGYSRTVSSMHKFMVCYLKILHLGHWASCEYQ